MLKYVCFGAKASIDRQFMLMLLNKKTTFNNNTHILYNNVCIIFPGRKTNMDHQLDQ